MNKDLNEKNRINEVYKKYINSKNVQNKWRIDNVGNSITHQERFDLIKKKFSKNDLDLKEKRILEVGCAGGYVIKSLIDMGAEEKNITGIDIRFDRLEEARNAFPFVTFEVMDASDLTFQDNTFDVITVFTVLSSVLNSKIRKIIASELIRVLKPDGVIIYYDLRYNNPWNRDVKRIMKSEIKKLFPRMKLNLELITLLPPLARKLNNSTSNLYHVFSKVPLLRTHHLGYFTKE